MPNKKLDEVIEEHNIFMLDFIVLQCIYYYSCKKNEFIKRVLSEPWSGMLAIYASGMNVNSLENSIDRLIEEKFIYIVNKKNIDDIVEHLEAFPGSVIFEELPSIDFVDMTLSGGKLWEKIQKSRSINEKRFSFTEYFEGYQKFLFCSNSRRDTEMELKNFLELNSPKKPTFFLKDGPRLIHNWRRRWWNSRVSKGYTFSVYTNYEEVEFGHIAIG